MLTWFTDNLITILTLAILGGLIALAVVSLVRDKKAGKGSCGGKCSSCALAGECHTASKTPAPKRKIGLTKTVLSIDGMMCGMCEAHINDAIRSAFPVKSVGSSHVKGETVILSEAPLDEDELKRVIGATGYRLSSISYRSF